MAKDPAALFYIDKWLIATKSMKADCRGWFLNLILHQFDKGELPNDLEELANFADVRISEYKRFKQVFEQVLQHKFKVNANGCLQNEYAKEILKARELFKEKRETAGKLSYFLKYVRKNLCQDENLIVLIKQLVDLSTVDVKNPAQIEQVFNQVFEEVKKQKSELFINENENINSDIKEGGPGETFQKPLTASNDFGKKFIVVEMATVWKKYRPEYVIDPLEENHELRAIAEKIGQAAQVSYENIEGVDRIKSLFDTLVCFSNTHALFKDYQISQFRKYFNNIASACKNQRSQQKAEQQNKSVVHQNFDAAQQAREILKKKRETATNGSVD